MKIERVISWFDKNTEKLLGEHNIDHVSLDILKTIFVPPESDPSMYNPYFIDFIKAEELSVLTGFVFNHDKYVYQIDCFQV